jgi:hypothetical protein
MDEPNTEAQLQYALSRMEERDAYARLGVAVGILHRARINPADPRAYNAVIDAHDAAWLDWKICCRLRNEASETLSFDTLDEPAISFGALAAPRLVSEVRPLAA